MSPLRNPADPCVVVDGVAYPRVSTILTTVGLGWAGWRQGASRERAAAIGRAVHRAVELDATGQLDETSVHPEVHPGLVAYRAFARDTGHVAEASELELIHPGWRYVGHPDRVGSLGGARVLIDWKYTDHPDLWAARYQLAAYRAAWNACHPDRAVTTAIVLQLRKSPATIPYQLHDLTAEADAVEQTFFAAVLVYQALAEREG